MEQTKTQVVEFPSNGQTTPGYLAMPDEAGGHPGLVVIQEWWGLVPHIKDVVERFAREGFVALAPDLYHGQATSEPDEARKLAMELDQERAVKEILAAMQYLRGLEAVSPKKIGVMGFCMGGSLTIATAVHASDLDAAVVFYGHLHDQSQVKNIRVPILGLYGENDQGIPVETVRAFEQELQKQNVPHEIHIYPGAGHAFFNDTRPHIYLAEAAQDAWRRTLAWFDKYLA